ncbi:MAG: hypothetical protein WD512_08765, partial [Candidatus Paceibacterota bacterium]
PQEEEVTDSNKASQTDDLTGSVKKKQSSFIDAVSNTAKQIKINEFFEKLKETNDPLLDQILSPVPPGDPVQEQEEQVEQSIGSEEQMRRGGQKRSKRKYNRLLNRANRLLGIEDDSDMFGLNQSMLGSLPMSMYNKNDDFIDQRFNNIDVPTLQKFYAALASQQTNLLNQDQVLRPEIDIYETGVFGRPKKYRISYPQGPKPSAEIQAQEAVIKNNLKKDNSLNLPAAIPQDPMTYLRNSLSLSPSNEANQEGVMFSDSEYDNNSYPPRNPDYQMGGYVPDYTDQFDQNLNTFVYGDTDFSQDSKNVNDPYFEDMDLARKGGSSRKDLKRKRRINNTTAFDILFPANRSLDYSGSYA